MGGRIRVECAFRDQDFGIYEFDRLSVIEFKGNAGRHGTHLVPDYADLLFVDGREEGIDRHGLGHACDFGHIGAVVGVVAGGVVVLSGSLVYDQKISVAH